MNPRTLIAIPALAALSAIAGPFDRPYALVESGDNSETRKEARATVTAVDGRSTLDTRSAEPVEPGRHTITIGFQSARGVFRPGSIDVAMVLEPCTRYRFVAAYESRTGPRWTPRAYTETIGECRKKFKQDEAR